MSISPSVASLPATTASPDNNDVKAAAELALKKKQAEEEAARVEQTRVLIYTGDFVTRLIHYMSSKKDQPVLVALQSPSCSIHDQFPTAIYPIIVAYQLPFASIASRAENYLWDVIKPFTLSRKLDSDNDMERNISWKSIYDIDNNQFNRITYQLWSDSVKYDLCDEHSSKQQKSHVAIANYQIGMRYAYGFYCVHTNWLIARPFLQRAFDLGVLRAAIVLAQLQPNEPNRYTSIIHNNIRVHHCAFSMITEAPYTRKLFGERAVQWAYKKLYEMAEVVGDPLALHILANYHMILAAEAHEKMNQAIDSIAPLLPPSVAPIAATTTTTLVTSSIATSHDGDHMDQGNDGDNKSESDGEGDDPHDDDGGEVEEAKQDSESKHIRIREFMVFAAADLGHAGAQKLIGDYFSETDIYFSDAAGVP
jgi:hypothetical protein